MSTLTASPWRSSIWSSEMGSCQGRQDSHPTELAGRCSCNKDPLGLNCREDKKIPLQEGKEAKGRI